MLGSPCRQLGCRVPEEVGEWRYDRQCEQVVPERVRSAGAEVQGHLLSGFLLKSGSRTFVAGFVAGAGLASSSLCATRIGSAFKSMLHAGRFS